MVNIEKRLERLCQSASRLNQNSNEATRKLEQVEKALVESGLGIEADVLMQEEHFDPDEGHPFTRTTHLVFGRLNTAWSLYVRESHFSGDEAEGPPSHVTERRICECSRAERGKAVNCLALLLDNLQAMADSTLAVYRPNNNNDD